MTTTDRILNDLAFAAPEIWRLHIDRRLAEFADEIEEKTLTKVYDGLAKSGLDPADYMAVIRLIGRIMAQ